MKNHVDISVLSDARPPAVLSADVILPTQSDVDKLLSDFEILISRSLLFKSNYCSVQSNVF